MNIRRKPHLILPAALAIAVGVCTPCLPKALNGGFNATYQARLLTATRGPEIAGTALCALRLGFGSGAAFPVISTVSAVDLARLAWTWLDYRTAIDVLDRALRSSPESAVLLSAYGSVYLKAEEPARAREYLDKAIHFDPDCPAAALGEAESRMLDHDYPAAERWLNQLLSKHPGTGEIASSAHALLARILLEGGKQDAAEVEAGKALEADPKSSNALYIMAFIKASEPGHRDRSLPSWCAPPAVSISERIGGLSANGR